MDKPLESLRLHNIKPFNKEYKYSLNYFKCDYRKFMFILNSVSNFVIK